MIVASEVVSLAARFCCVARAVCLLELACSLKDMQPGGLLNWTVTGLVDFSSPSGARVHLEALIARLSHKLFILLLAVDAVVVTTLFIFPSNSILLIAAAALMLIQMKRHYMSYDGADEMIFFCFVALSVGRIAGADKVTAWFLAAEASLAYLVAGAYKAASPFWKKGQALVLITRTRLFGHEGVARMLQRYPAATRSLEFVFVLWECIFPIALLVPLKILLPMLAIGLIFHIACAWVMGLNTFIWAFLATYPALIFANQELRSWLSPNAANDLAIGLALAILLVVAIATVQVPRTRPLERDYVGGLVRPAGQ